MKKHLAILLITLANISMLAHGVVAHHHHNGYVTVSTHETHSHNGVEGEHHHNQNHCNDCNSNHSDNSASSVECFLKNVALNKKSKSDFAVAVDVELLYASLTVILHFTYSDTLLSSECSNYKPYLECGYNIPDVDYHTLRGPPVC